MTGACQQRMELRCSTCKQVIGGPTRNEATNVDVNFFGAKRYSVCPTCNQVVPEELRTPAYKSVWTRKRGLQAKRLTSVDAERSNETKATGSATPLDHSHPYSEGTMPSAKDVAQWMYDEVTRRAFLWNAYAVAAITDKFGKIYTYCDEDETPRVCKLVLHEFGLLCRTTVIWDERLAQWRLR